MDVSSVCSISKQSDLASLIKHSRAIVWDEAPMIHRYALEAVDRTLRDITGCNLPFGGKIVILGGDFRQVLPVIPGGTKAQLISASIVKSELWKGIQVLHLKKNMRAVTDPLFSDLLLRIGDGKERTFKGDFVRLPSSMVIPWEGQSSIYRLIHAIFPNLHDHANDPNYMVDRALITPKNDVDTLNATIITMLPTSERVYYSWDSIEDDSQDLYQQEFLNSITSGGLPPHKLTLRKGSPMMLLRNLDPQIGLCNGTRLLCRELLNNCIDAEILTGHYKGTRTFVHRMPLKCSETLRLPFELTRRQFPLQLSFALTINKAQGQTIPNVGVFLPDHVFSHGQLYVALSRGVAENSTKILVKNGDLEREEGVFTRNVVYTEVLSST